MSSLFFLDDHKNVLADAQFWKFAVTGADNNQEIKIWSCESWNCLQTVRFLCPQGLPSNFAMEPCMKAALDLSARYFILSDIRRRVGTVVMILNIQTDRSGQTVQTQIILKEQQSACYSVCIFWKYIKRILKSHSSNFRIITSSFYVVRILWRFMLLP